MWMVKLDEFICLGDGEGVFGPEFFHLAWETDRRSDAELVAAAMRVLGYPDAMAVPVPQDASTGG